MLVFTQYVAMARLLERHLARAGVPHQFLHGGTPVARAGGDGGALPGRRGSPVFLLSLKAGGTGLNLTRADHVVHVDRWWNPAVEEQATDRAYRIGQTRPVQVHRLVTQGTIEEKIAELLARKRALADSVLARGEAALTELSNDELRDLVTPARDGRRDRRDTTVTHPRSPPRRGGGAAPGGARRGARAVEESAYAVAELRRGAALARAGEVGADRRRRRRPRRGGQRRRRRLDGHRTRAGARRPRPRQPSSSSSPPSPGGSPRCSPASCRTRWSSMPRRPASSCCRTAASWARPAPATRGSTRARTRWRCSPRWPGCSRPTRSCCSSCAASRARTCWPGCTSSIAVDATRRPDRGRPRPTTSRWPRTRRCGPQRMLPALDADPAVGPRRWW